MYCKPAFIRNNFILPFAGDKLVREDYFSWPWLIHTRSRNIRDEEALANLTEIFSHTKKSWFTVFLWCILIFHVHILLVPVKICFTDVPSTLFLEDSINQDCPLFCSFTRVSKLWNSVGWIYCHGAKTSTENKISWCSAQMWTRPTCTSSSV